MYYERYKTLVVVCISILCITGCKFLGRSPESISLEEATALFRRAEQLAQQGNASALTEMSDNPSYWLEVYELNRGEESAPSEPAHITGSVIQHNVTDPDGTLMPGGRILMFSGIDGLGDPYNGWVMIFDDGGKLKLEPPLYWIRSYRTPN